MKLKLKIKEIMKLIFPSTWQELILFLIFLGAYGSFAYYLAVNFRIVYDERIPWDAYFSFDNRSIVTSGGGFERHPLSNYFFSWIQDFALWISDGKKDAQFRIVLALLSSLTVSLSLIQIFKYLKNIIQLPNIISYSILGLFSLFTTNILLSFTPETYTYTLLLLCLFNYYVAKQFKNNKALSFVAITLAGVSIGGLTITNIVKVYLPQLFQKNLYWNWRKIGIEISKVAVSVAVFLLLFLYRLDFNFMNFFNKTGEQYEKFSKPKVTPLWDMIYSWFFGGNMLFSSFVVRDYHNAKGFEYKAIFMDVFSNWSSYLVVGIIVFLILWSFFRNFKNRLVQILFWSFCFDILIHCILKFGLHTSYIYGGHFVFVYPLLLGWLFYSYKDSPKMLSGLLSLIMVLIVYFGVNNYLRLQEFIDFLNVYYT
ncbi:DUF6080 domain-containing protein [Chryseobacterium sp. T1]